MKFKVIKFKTVNSTNNIALRLIKNGKINSSIILTKIQKKGRGQYNNEWISLNGNLFFTIYYEIDPQVKLNPLIKKNCNILKSTLSAYTKKRIKIKKPNDLYFKGKKLGGLLHETLFYKEKKFLIIGIGINTVKNPIILTYPTTNLSEISDKKISNSVIFNVIKRKFENKIK